MGVDIFFNRNEIFLHFGSKLINVGLLLAVVVGTGLARVVAGERFANFFKLGGYSKFCGNVPTFLPRNNAFR